MEDKHIAQFLKENQRFIAPDYYKGKLQKQLQKQLQTVTTKEVFSDTRPIERVYNKNIINQGLMTRKVRKIMSDNLVKCEDSFIEMKDKAKIYYKQEFVPEMRAVIVVVHGVCEHCGRYSYLSKALNDAGYGVIRFDLRGHGKSEGERGYIKSFIDFAREVEEVVIKANLEAPGVPVYMLGHSMGAFISASYAILYPGRVGGQILSGLPATVLPLPSIRLLKLLPYNIFPKILAGNDLGKVVSRDPMVVKDYISDPLNLKKSTIKMSGEMFLKGPAWLSRNIDKYDTPCLLLHGESDLIVTPDSSLWFYNNIKSQDKKRITYPGLYHEIFNEKERDTVIADVIGWLDDKSK